MGTFFSALVPKSGKSSAPRALVPIAETVLLAKGRVTRWLCTGADGEATEKLSTDAAAMLRVFKAAGAAAAAARARSGSARCIDSIPATRPPPLPRAAAHPDNEARLTTVCRRLNGTTSVLDLEQSVYFFGSGLTAADMGMQMHGAHVRWGRR